MWGKLKCVFIQMPLNIDTEFAEACEQGGVQGARCKTTAPVASTQTFGHKTRPPDCRDASSVHDCHVLVAAHGNPSVEIGENVC